MATFRKRSSGSWQARIQRKGYPDITKSFKTRSEAAEWARKVEHELVLGLIPKVLKGTPRASQGLVFDITPHAISVAFIRACKRAGIAGLRCGDQAEKWNDHA